MIVSFEQLEAARYVSYLKKDGTIITNTQKISPMPVITGAAEYPRRHYRQDKGYGYKHYRS